MILHLKELMKSKGISSIALAESVGVSKATVSYWLNGKVFPAPETLEKIASALGVPVWQLFASPEEVKGADSCGGFVALVRNGGETLTFDTKEDLVAYAKTLMAGAQD